MININSTNNLEAKIVPDTNGSNYKNESVFLRKTYNANISSSLMVDIRIGLTGSAWTSIMTGSITDYACFELVNMSNYNIAVRQRGNSVTASIGLIPSGASTFIWPSGSIQYDAITLATGSVTQSIRIAGVSRT